MRGNTWLIRHSSQVSQSASQPTWHCSCVAFRLRSSSCFLIRPASCPPEAAAVVRQACSLGLKGQGIKRRAALGMAFGKGTRSWARKSDSHCSGPLRTGPCPVLQAGRPRPVPVRRRGDIVRVEEDARNLGAVVLARAQHPCGPRGAREISCTETQAHAGRSLRRLPMERQRSPLRLRPCT